MLEVHSVHQDLDTICFRAQSTLAPFLAQHASAILLTTQVLPELKVHESIHHDLTHEKRVKLSQEVHTMSNGQHPHTLPYTNTTENPALKGPKNPTKRKNIVSIIYDSYSHGNNSMSCKEKGQALIDILLTQLLSYNTTHTTSTTGDHLATLYQSHIKALSAHISPSSSTIVAQTTTTTTSLRAAVPVHTKADKILGSELLGASDVCFFNDLVYKYHTVSPICTYTILVYICDMHKSYIYTHIYTTCIYSTRCG